MLLSIIVFATLMITFFSFRHISLFAFHTGYCHAHDTPAFAFRFRHAGYATYAMPCH